jgi:phosphatidylinositol kinase/protein kinase (PI-3  family)
MTLRRHHHRLVLLLEMIAKGNEHLDCFGGNPNRVVEDMRTRFFPDVNDSAAVEGVHRLIDESIDNWTTTCYDRYQRFVVGIF